MIQKAFDLARLGVKVAHPEILKTPEQVLSATVRALRRHRIPFLVHGAWALAAYGHPRATDDFDFLAVSDAGARGRLERAMASIRAFPVEPSGGTHIAYNAFG